MRTAVDTSILLDVFLPDPVFGERSRKALTVQHDAGVLIVCDVVWAETRAHFPSSAVHQRVMNKLGFVYEPIGEAAAAHAGEAWQAYRRAGGKRERLVADFLIAAFATHQCDALLTRDRGFYKRRFKRLKVIEP